MITGCVSWSPGGRDMGRHLQRIFRQPHSQHHAASQQSSQLSRGPGRGEDHSGRTINKSIQTKNTSIVFLTQFSAHFKCVLKISSHCIQ